MNTISGGSYRDPSQMSLIDVLFPGFSMASVSVQQLLTNNLDSYTRLFYSLGIFVLFARYTARYFCDIDLRISSISLNTNILKSLIEECREKYLKGTQKKNAVFPINEAIFFSGYPELENLALLPLYYIVLLEDVDTAGVRRRDSVDVDQENESKSAVTLSGLLNILDSVSSQEGRTLIMTTNHIEYLDKALIRSSRSDKKIHFKLADQNISTQLFRTVFKQLPSQKQYNEEYDDETIEAFARNFASKVPDQVFSPAEVLSFLLKCKKSPSDAVSCVESWVVKAKY
ncbi:P-loop containing nucleoside triphosphate hydrolase protein [Penicillium alfredii]|uniref:P-loop containing nucleoside triphosphate hydrolase protein n=1 Tax=Penicillium alfredii TaxID=1506179 RepID=A0A9W9JYD2_9EURO|nr:P-loop containing nucleoside triphosphate hydrolase protein [Penicillium alfredii]KAJ5086504.1 P-loop containing nucleoside triphosphate hydrolase protein [Penicillium alfredii]